MPSLALQQRLREYNQALGIDSDDDYDVEPSISHVCRDISHLGQPDEAAVQPRGHVSFRDLGDGTMYAVHFENVEKEIKRSSRVKKEMESEKAAVGEAGKSEINSVQANAGAKSGGGDYGKQAPADASRYTGKTVSKAEGHTKVSIPKVAETEDSEAWVEVESSSGMDDDEWEMVA
ncbi:hypothetical protein MBLNU230_g7567t1 [Neophaeotheca triangularis]